MRAFAWGYSSVGRATRSQCVGQGFDSPYLHQDLKGLSLYHLAGILAVIFYSLFSPFVGSESNSFYFGNSRRDVSFCGIICSLMACILRAFLLCSVFAFFMYGTELFAIWPIILSTLLCILLLTYGVIFFKNRTKNQFQKKPRKAYTTKDIINGKHIKK